MTEAPGPEQPEEKLLDRRRGACTRATKVLKLQYCTGSIPAARQRLERHFGIRLRAVRERRAAPLIHDRINSISLTRMNQTVMVEKAGPCSIASGPRGIETAPPAAQIRSCAAKVTSSSTTLRNSASRGIKARFLPLLQPHFRFYSKKKKKQGEQGSY